MKYYVEVTRISYARHTLAVEAPSVDHVWDLALRRAPEEDFSTFATEEEGALAEAAEKRLVGTGWLPKLMRTGA